MAFRIVSLGSDEADYSFYDLSRRCEPLETEYDDYMTYYEKMEFEKELPSFEDFFKKAQYNSDLVFPGLGAASAVGRYWHRRRDNFFIPENFFCQLTCFYPILPRHVTF